MQRKLITMLVAAGFMATSACALAQDPQDKDRQFISNASEGGLTEVSFGKLAAQKAQDPDVKAFAIKMVHDHSALNDKMKIVAVQLNATLAQHMSVAHDTKYSELKVLQGAEFDRAYIEVMESAHHQDLRDFQHEQSAASDPHLKQVVSEGEKVIAMHTDMVDKLARRMDIKIVN
jgi:putative membrane protein